MIYRLPIHFSGVVAALRFRFSPPRKQCQAKVEDYKIFNIERLRRPILTAAIGCVVPAVLNNQEAHLLAGVGGFLRCGGVTTGYNTSNCSVDVLNKSSLELVTF